MEDSTGCMHGSRGVVAAGAPASAVRARDRRRHRQGDARRRTRRSDWDAGSATTRSIRDAIAETYPEIFHDFNARMWTPGGFRRPIGRARARMEDPNGKANSSCRAASTRIPTCPRRGRTCCALMTMRSDDQFNTTVYGYDDRFRGVYGTRMVLLMNRARHRAAGLQRRRDGQPAHRGRRRPRAASVDGLRVTRLRHSRGLLCRLLPGMQSADPAVAPRQALKVPAAKSIPVRVAPRRSASARHARND